MADRQTGKGWGLNFDTIPPTSATVIGFLRDMTGIPKSVENIDVSAVGDAEQNNEPGIQIGGGADVELYFDSANYVALEAIVRVKETWTFSNSAGHTWIGTGWIDNITPAIRYRGEMTYKIRIMPETKFVYT